MIGYFDKDKYIIETPKTPRNWTNKLFNDSYLLELSGTMQGDSRTFMNYEVTDFIKKQSRVERRLDGAK